MPRYTKEEVARHNSETDLWIVYGETVYDVSPFVGRHPGGRRVLAEAAGRDVTERMSDPAAGPHRHSPAALRMLEDYRVGTLQTTDEEGEEEEGGGSKKKRSGDDHNRITGQANGNGVNNFSEYAEVKKKYDDLVSANHPMFWEIGKLGRSYMDWIFTPDDKDLRLFASDFLESLSVCQWYIIPLVWLPIIGFFLYRSYSNFVISNGHETWMPGVAGGISVSIRLMPLLFVFGVLVWTFAEYAIHRWVFHFRPPHWSRVLITLHFLLHGQHHKSPMNRNRLVFPPVPAMPFAFVYWFLVTSLFPVASAQCVLSGIAFGYVIYDLTHYYLHHGSPTTSYFKDLKNYHVKHHYVYHESGFGISSKLWDYPFGTVIRGETENLKVR